MTVLKKNPIFSVSVAVCVLAFLGLGYMALSANGELKKSKQRLKGALRHYNEAAKAEIAPTEVNLSASQLNVEELQRQFSVVSGELRKGTRLTSTDDGIEVTTAIRDYVRKFQRQAKSTEDSAGELMETSIEIPEDFAFGFGEYYPKTNIPDDPQEVIFLGKQRQLLSYMMTKLMAARPKSIDSIERELYSTGTDEGVQPGGFVIDPVLSAAVPGAINTVAFRIQFTGSTDSLRQFFSNLNTFDLPIVVRSVEVSRSQGEGISVETDRGGLEEIFGAFGDSPTTPATTNDVSLEPVIIGDSSQFTLVLEYFEVVHPATNQSAEDQS